MAEVLKRGEFPSGILSGKNIALSTDDYFRLWDSLEKTVNDPLFPLRLGTVITAESFSPAIFAVFCSSNMNEAVSRLSQYKKLIGPMTLGVEVDEDKTIITLDCLYTDKPLPESLIAFELVFLVHLVRLATREKINPLSVSNLSRILNDKAYTDFFGVTPKSGKLNQVIFSSEDAKLPFLSENQGMWGFFEPELRKRLSDFDEKASFANRVRSSLLELLPAGQGSTEEVARKLAISKRTMQRHLSIEKTSFQAELKKTREQLSRHYLANSTLTGSEISFLLGFDDPNSFARAFRKWTGVTPKRMRSEMFKNQ
ncbi:MAG: AraC family transcriptional regulator [Desulfobacterales bacterium]|nr:AraC family transcriptional regulator [Desulfobacterales bacterium]